MAEMQDYGDRLLDESIRLGLANRETIELARRHCLHMTFVESGGRGMAEEATGLPINMRTIECPQARGGGMAMNLEWVAVDFYKEHCVGCEHRRPTGEVPNLASAVEGSAAAAAAKDVARRAALERRREEWQRRRERRRTLLVGADNVMHGALEDIGVLDAEPDSDFDLNTRAAALRRLDVLADRAPGTFTADVIELVLGLIEHERVSELLDPLRRITRTRTDLASAVLSAALGTLRTGTDSHAAACVTELAEHLVADALDPQVLESLIIEAGAPDDRIGFAPRRPNDPAPLRVAADVAPGRVITAVVDLLPLLAESSTLIVPAGALASSEPGHVDDFRRASAGGAAHALAATHQSVADALVDRLVRSLAVDSAEYSEEAPIHAAQRALAAMLVLGRHDVIDSVETAGRNAAKELRARLFRVIDLSARLVDPHDRWRTADDPRLADDEARAVREQLFAKCLTRVAGDWGSEVAYSAAGTVKVLAASDPVWAVRHIPAFLGAFLSVVEQASEPTGPTLAVVEQTPAFLAGLEEFTRQTTYGSIARELLDAVQAAAGADPIAACDAIMSIVADDRDADRASAVRRRLIGTLGAITRQHADDPDILNDVLPVLHGYIVDSDPALRSAALHAWTEIGARNTLPSSVADLLPALIEDNKIVVIEALLEAARRLTWTDEDRDLLVVYAVNICEKVPATADDKMLTEAMSALRSLTRDAALNVRVFAERLIVRRAGDLDNYKLRDALRGKWLPTIEHSESMARLRLRLTRDPVINDRWNRGDDDEMCDLLDCGIGLATLPLTDLVDGAVELAPNMPFASAEFAEVAWRAGRSSDAASIMRAVTSATPETPAYDQARALTTLYAEAAAFDAAVAAGDSIAAAAPPVAAAAAAVDFEDNDRSTSLTEQIKARVQVRTLLANEQPPVEIGIAPVPMPAAKDPAQRRRERAERLDAAGTALAGLSQRATATGAYMRSVAVLCGIGSHLLSLDAAELDGDTTAAAASLIAAQRRAELLDEEVRRQFTTDDPIARALIQACDTARAITSGTAVADVLSEWARLPLPLLILDGPTRHVRPRSAAVEAEVAEPDVAVVLASVDGKLITGPQVLRQGWVYELQVEVQPGDWPEWAERLEVDLIGHVSPVEITLPAYSWTRTDAGADGTFVSAGSMVLRFGLTAGRPAPPFAVRLLWRGNQDGKPVTERVDVAGHRQLRFRPFDASRDGMTGYPTVDEHLLTLYERLHGAGYDEGHIQAFCRLFTAVCRVGFRVTWDKKYKRGARVTERAFHDDLFAELLADPELGGRLERGSPLALGYLDLRHDRITAELKVERQTPVTRDRAPKYMGQPTQYAAADGVRLSILCILDMSPKESPIGTPENYVFTLDPALHGLDNPEAPSLVATIVVNGNLPTPSSWSRRKTQLRDAP